MIWNICFAVMSAFAALSIILAFGAGIFKNRNDNIINPFNILTAGIFAALFTGLIPVSFSGGGGFQITREIMTAILSTIQAFALNTDAVSVNEEIIQSGCTYAQQYALIMSILFLAAPLMTFSFIVSLIINFSPYPKYFFSMKKKVFIFSGLTVKSAFMAKDLKMNNRNALIVFTDTDKKENDASDDITDQLRKDGAVFFRKNILEVDFRRSLFSGRKQIDFYVMSENDSDNIDQTVKLIEKYRNRKNTRLFVFVSDLVGEIALSHIDTGCMKVRQIDHIHSLIYRSLFLHGDRIFEKAAELEKGPGKRPDPDERVPLNTLVVGMGRYGKEMVKALSWYGQMDGYRICIDAFESDNDADSKFRFECPELMDDAHNGNYDPEDGEYLIRIHSGIKADTEEYFKEIRKLKKVAYVLVSLGNDHKNIRAAVSLRRLFEQIGESPLIQTVVYHPELSEAVGSAESFRGQPYNIEYIGDIRTLYSENVIINSDLEREAFERHKKRHENSEDNFWKYEYYYRSASASAVHMKARKSCGLCDPADSERIAALEHRRRNTYLRSEGYVFSGSSDIDSGNDIGKTHSGLIRYSILSENEKEKERKISGQ